MSNIKKKIIVVGAGPAGIIAAIRAGELGQKVILVEKNTSLGRKLLITGNSRCNLTNTYDLETFISKIPGNGNFLRSAFKKMFNVELIEFFEKRGVRFVTEKGHKVFPLTGMAETILDVLKKELEKNKVKVFYSLKMAGIDVEKNRAIALRCDDGSRIECDALIIATGGITYPGTGSTGEGFRIVEKTGHKVIKPRPGLVPLDTVQKYPKILEGLTCQDIKLTFRNERKKSISGFGDLMFTSTGISGPVVLSVSGTVADWLEEKQKVFAEIDLMPELTLKETEEFLIQEFGKSPGKSIKNSLKNIVPARFAELVISISGIEPDKKTGNISREDRKAILERIKKFTLDIKKIKGLSHAVITRGGVSLKEIDPRTMESKKIKGLYFAGEVIDIDGDTGGFNLQIAFSTGYLAGESAASS